MSVITVLWFYRSVSAVQTLSSRSTRSSSQGTHHPDSGFPPCWGLCWTWLRGGLRQPDGLLIRRSWRSSASASFTQKKQEKILQNNSRHHVCASHRNEHGWIFPCDSCSGSGYAPQSEGWATDLKSFFLFLNKSYFNIQYIIERGCSHLEILWNNLTDSWWHHQCMLLLKIKQIFIKKYRYHYTLFIEHTWDY